MVSCVNPIVVSLVFHVPRNETLLIVVPVQWIDNAVMLDGIVPQSRILVKVHQFLINHKPLLVLWRLVVLKFLSQQQLHLRIPIDQVSVVVYGGQSQYFRSIPLSGHRLELALI